MAGFRFAPMDLSGFGGEKKNKRVPLQYSVKDAIVRRQKGRCAGCNVNFYTADVSIHIDHKKSVSKGGSNNPKNLQALCPNCHTKKHRKERVADATKRKKKTSNDTYGFGMTIPQSQNPYRGLKIPKPPKSWY